MNKKVVDTRGCGCPEPVLMTKRAVGADVNALQVLVDNNTSKENVSRFARSQGYSVEVVTTEDGYTLELTK